MKRQSDAVLAAASANSSLESLSRIERTHQRLWTLALLLLLLLGISLLAIDTGLSLAERLLWGAKIHARGVLLAHGPAAALLAVLALICAYFRERLLSSRDQNRELVRALDASARMLALRNHQLDTWDEISHQLITNFNLPRLLELTASTAAEMTESDCAAVFLSERDSPHLRLAAIHRRGAQTELARRVAATVVATGQGMHVRPGSLPQELDRPDLAWEDLVSLAACPLLAADGARGALLVGRLAPALPYPLNVLKVLGSFANQASIGLEKAQLYADGQRQLHRLETILEELRASQQQPAEGRQIAAADNAVQPR